MNEVKKLISKENLTLQEIFTLIKMKFYFIRWSLIIFILIGILITVTTKDEYTATSKFLLESQGGSGQNQLRGLAGLAGVNLSQMGAQELNILTPDLYPVIASSDYFLLRVSNFEYTLESGQKKKLSDFFSDYSNDNLFITLKNFISNSISKIGNVFKRKKVNSNLKEVSETKVDSIANFNQIIFYSSDEKNSIRELNARVLLQYDNKILTVETKMPEAGISAELNKVIIDQFVNYITDYQTNKKSKNLQFLESRVEEAQSKFINVQMQLASFRDKNFGIISQSEKTKEERLVAEFNLAFNLYNSLALEYEKAKIQLQNETPVFTVFEPVTIPNKPSEPNLIRNLVIFSLAGFVMGCFLAIGSIFYDYLK